MTEHHHEHLEEAQSGKGGSSSQVAGAVLLGSIILAASIFYNSKIIVKKLDQSGVVKSAQDNGGQAQQAAAPSPSPAPSAAPQQPTGPITVKDRDDEPSQGSKSAKVTIYEFADFQCPFCKSFHDQSFSQIKSNYIDTGKVRYVFRHFPLSFHQNAQISAVAAECANRQGKFWDMHETLFSKGSGDGTGLAAADLKQYAKQIGLNTSKFNQCLDNNETLSVVKADNDLGTSVGVSGTPSFVINGKLVVGAQPYATFQQEIENALKN